MSKKILTSTLILAPVLLTSCGNNEQMPTLKSDEKKTDIISQENEVKKGSDEAVTSNSGNRDTNTKDETSNVDVSSMRPDSSSAIVAGSSITKEIHYDSPAGDETVEFTLTTSGDTITAVSAKPLATHPISKNLQTKFSESISKEVIGKKKSELQLDAVGGASLTTNAFKQFVAQN